MSSNASPKNVSCRSRSAAAFARWTTCRRCCGPARTRSASMLRRWQTGGPGGGVARRQGRRRAGGQHFSLWRIHHMGGETVSGESKYSCASINGKTKLRTAVNFYDQLKFNSDGLIPAIIQEKTTGRVLMMAWM